MLNDSFLSTFKGVFEKAGFNYFPPALTFKRCLGLESNLKIYSLSLKKVVVYLGSPPKGRAGGK